MADLVIGVGGGGQHIALVIARLVRLGLWGESPDVVIIDADDTSPLYTKKLQPFGGYVRAVEAHPLRSVKIHPPFNVGTLGPAGTFADLFKRSTGTEEAQLDPDERDLLELFYDGDLAATQIMKGMYARPCVGSSVFALAGSAMLENEIVSDARREGRALVVGSFIGGTGAGIIHQLAPWLQRRLGATKVLLHGSFLLNWLDVGSDGKDANRKTTDASMQHGIEHFFRHTREAFKSSVLVGVPPRGGQVSKAADSNDETVSVYPLLAAYGLYTVVRDTVSQGGVFFLEGDPTQWKWLLEAPWGDQANRIDLRWKELDTITRLIDWMDIDKEVGYDAIRRFQAFGFGQDTSEWKDAIVAAAEKLGVTNHGDFALEVFKAFIERQKQIGFVTSWLGTIFGQGAPDSALPNETSNHKQTRDLFKNPPGFFSRSSPKSEAFKILAKAYRTIPEGAVRKVPTSREDAVRTLSGAMEDALRAWLRS